MKTFYVAEDGTQFDDRQACIDYENKPYIYAIENNVNEYHSNYTRFCSTLEEAKRELEDCCDWFRKKALAAFTNLNLIRESTLRESLCMR